MKSIWRCHQIKKRYFRSSKGSAGLPMTLGLLFSTVMVGSIAVDTGVYFAEQKNMQNAADAAALAGSMELFRSTSTDPDDKQDDAMDAAVDVAEENGYVLDTSDIHFGYSDPNGSYDAGGFGTGNPNYSSTGGFNSVQVILRRGDGDSNAPITTFLSQTFGRDGMPSTSHATGIYGGAIDSASGLRPVYLCQGVYDKAVELYGDPTSVDIILYDSANGNNGGGNGNNNNGGESDSNVTIGNQELPADETCGDMPPGSFGFSDFSNSNGSPGVPTVRDWWENGYDDPVYVGNSYEPQPGNQLHAYNSEIDTLIDNGTVLMIPLYDSTSGNGSNALFHLSGIVPFVITDSQTTGNPKTLTGRFTKTVCRSGCQTASAPNEGYGVTKLRLIH